MYMKMKQIYRFTYQVKCIQYWSELAKSMRYGHFTVDTIEERHYAHYSIRKFKVCNRKVWIIEKKGQQISKTKPKVLQKISKIQFASVLHLNQMEVMYMNIYIYRNIRSDSYINIIIRCGLTMGFPIHCRWLYFTTMC